MAGLDPLNARLARGEPEAFETVYDLYGPRLHAFLWGWTRDRQAAEDLLQAVMLRLARHRARLRGVGSLRAWLYVVARNEAKRRWSRRPPPSAGTEALSGLAGPDASIDGDGEALRRALGALSRERFEVVTLKVHHDLTFAEVGEVLAIPPNTAASRYRRALDDLREELETADVER